jgi:hypothetical protein
VAGQRRGKAHLRPPQESHASQGGALADRVADVAAQPQRSVERRLSVLVLMKEGVQVALSQ